MPSVVAHRGFKRVYPENTLLAFTQARNAGASVVELDLQLTKDDNIVVSHDANTARTFNRDLNIHKAVLSDIAGIRTKREPHESMPTIKSLLIWAMKPENDNVKLMLDIKSVNRLEIFNVLQKFLVEYSPAGRETEASKLEYWQKKLIIGIWNQDQYLHIIEHGLLKSFEKVVISFILATALDLLEISDRQDNENKITGVSLLQILSWDPVLYKSYDASLDEKLRYEAPIVYLMLKYVVPKKVQLYFWTVNSNEDMNWCLNFPFVAGLVGDNPDKLAEKVQSMGEISEPQTEEERLAYFRKKISTLGKLRPRIYSKVGFKRNMLLCFYKVILVSFRYRLHTFGFFGFSFGHIMFKVSQFVGLV